MQTFVQVRSLIEKNPQSKEAVIVSSLIAALESGGDYALSTLYALEPDDFALALALIPAWRADRLQDQKLSLLKLTSSLAQPDFVPKPIRVRGDTAQEPTSGATFGGGAFNVAR